MKLNGKIELKNNRASVDVSQDNEGVITINIFEDNKTTGILIMNNESHSSSLNVHLCDVPDTPIKKVTNHRYPNKDNGSCPFTVVDLESGDRHGDRIISVFHDISPK